MVEAEEYGITSKNVDEILKSRNLGDGSPLKFRAVNGRKSEQEPDHSRLTFGWLQVRNSLLHCRQDHS